MKRFHRPFFALLLSVLLLAAQQAAFAHLLGHLGSTSRAATSYQQDHGATDRLAEACTTCIAFAGMGGNAPPTGFVPSFASFEGDCPDAVVADAVAARRIDRYDARAPPTLL